MRVLTGQLEASALTIGINELSGLGKEIQLADMALVGKTWVTDPCMEERLSAQGLAVFVQFDEKKYVRGFGRLGHLEQATQIVFG